MNETTREFRIPSAVNTLVIVFITSVQLGMLVIVSRGLQHPFDSSHAWSWLGTCTALVVFGITGITTYQAMHEAEHGVLFENSRMNYLGGVYLAALFGGAFSLMRACHLGHHARNRTKAECFEMIWPGENVFVRTVFFYVFFLFLFWVLVPVSTVLLAITPKSLRMNFVLRSMRAKAMVDGAPKHWLLAMQLEAWFTIALHAVLLYSGLVDVKAWALCYLAVAVLWSSQNYLGHAHDKTFLVKDGGFNLDVNPVYRMWIMNFNWHLAHHQHPSVPWIHLPHFDDTSREHISFARAYLRFLSGPVIADANCVPLVEERHTQTLASTPT